MITYSRDRFGIPIEIVDDEPEKVGATWKKQDIYEDEQILTHEAMYKKEDGSYSFEKRYLFEDDVQEYVETLLRSDINEALRKLDIDELIEIFEMEKGWL